MSIYATLWTLRFPRHGEPVIERRVSTPIAICRAYRSRISGQSVSTSSASPGRGMVERSWPMRRVQRNIDCVRDASGGFGVAVWDATASIDRFRFDANALAGAQVARGSTMAHSHGPIARHPIALHVQQADFSPDRDLVDVRLVDNQRNYDADVLPVPEPSAPDLSLEP